MQALGVCEWVCDVAHFMAKECFLMRLHFDDTKAWADLDVGTSALRVYLQQHTRSRNMNIGYGHFSNLRTYSPKTFHFVFLSLFITFLLLLLSFSWVQEINRIECQAEAMKNNK